MPWWPGRVSGPSATCRLLSLVALWAVAVGCTAAYPYRLSTQYGPGSSFMRVTLLGAVEIPAQDVDGFVLTELSALGWDDDEDVLYALTDQGRLFHLAPVFRDGLLVDVDVLAGYALRDRHGKAFRGRLADAEGMALSGDRNARRGDTRLTVSFERQPRVLAFSPRGEFLGTLALPPPLSDPEAYAGANHQLEALAIDASEGVLTGPEFALRGAPADTITIYALGGKTWRFPRYPAPKSALVAMAALPDGTLLTLERSFSGVWSPLIITLRLTAPLATRPEGGPLAVEDIAIFNSRKRWRIDNFEGLARHRDKRFFMVSDDNENPLQKTLLVYFELRDTIAPPLPPPDER